MSRQTGRRQRVSGARRSAGVQSASGLPQVLQGRGRARQFGARRAPRRPSRNSCRWRWTNRSMSRQRGARQRPGELGEGDHQVADADVGAEPAGRPGALHEALDGLFEALARGDAVGVVLVEAAGEHRAQRADPLVGGGVDEAPQRREGVGLLGERAARPRSVVRAMTEQDDLMDSARGRGSAGRAWRCRRRPGGRSRRAGPRGRTPRTSRGRPSTIRSRLRRASARGRGDALRGALRCRRRWLHGVHSPSCVRSLAVGAVRVRRIRGAAPRFARTHGSNGETVPGYFPRSRL